MTTQLNARVGEVTNRIAGRSRSSRQAYLARIDAAVANGPARKRLGCANFAHGFAACAPGDKEALREGSGANLAIVTAYNDMLSATSPMRAFPISSRRPRAPSAPRPRSRAACPPCATASPRARKGWSFPFFRATSLRCQPRSPFRTICSTRRSISASATRLCPAS